MFRFGLNHSPLGSYHTFTRWVEPLPSPPAPAALTPAKTDDGLTGDQRLAKWLLGRWTSSGADGIWEWDFNLPIGSSGLYAVKIFNAGQEVGSFHGQWFVVAGQLTLTVGVSFYPPMRANTTETFKIVFPAADGFILMNLLDEYFTTLARKK